MKITATTLSKNINIKHKFKSISLIIRHKCISQNLFTKLIYNKRASIRSFWHFHQHILIITCLATHPFVNWVVNKLLGSYWHSKSCIWTKNFFIFIRTYSWPWWRLVPEQHINMIAKMKWWLKTNFILSHQFSFYKYIIQIWCLLISCHFSTWNLYKKKTYNSRFILSN